MTEKAKQDIAPDTPAPQFLSAQDMRTALCVSKSMLAHLTKTGALPSCKVGRRRLYPKSFLVSLQQMAEKEMPKAEGAV
jgi:hypothetical protein